MKRLFKNQNIAVTVPGSLDAQATNQKEKQKKTSPLSSFPLLILPDNFSKSSAEWCKNRINVFQREIDMWVWCDKHFYGLCVAIRSQNQKVKCFDHLSP